MESWSVRSAGGGSTIGPKTSTRAAPTDYRAVSEWTSSCTSADGAPIEAEGADLFTLRDGKIVVKQALRKDRPLQKS